MKLLRRSLSVDGELAVRICGTTITGINQVLFLARSQRPDLQDVDWLGLCDQAYLERLSGYFVEGAAGTARGAYRVSSTTVSFVINPRLNSVNGALVYALRPDTLREVLTQGFALAHDLPVAAPTSRARRSSGSAGTAQPVLSVSDLLAKPSNP